MLQFIILSVQDPPLNYLHRGLDIVSPTNFTVKFFTKVGTTLSVVVCVAFEFIYCIMGTLLLDLKAYLSVNE